MQITWTNCADAMPPRTYEETVIIKGYPDKQLMFILVTANPQATHYQELPEVPL